jgi:hypothetical protein
MIIVTMLTGILVLMPAARLMGKRAPGALPGNKAIRGN